MENQDYEEQQNTNYSFSNSFTNYCDENKKLKMNMLQIIESIEKEFLKNMPENLSLIDKLFALKGIINSEELSLNKLKLLNDAKKQENPKSQNNKLNNINNNKYEKEEKEALIRQLEAKNMLLNDLKVEYFELKEKMERKEKEISQLNRENNKDFYSKEEYLSLYTEFLNQNKIIEELNEELKKNIEENKQKSEILKKKGIKYLAGIEQEMTKEEIIENYIIENKDLKQQNKDLKEIADVASQKKKILKEYLDYEKQKDLKNKTYQKEISNLKSENEKKEKEINNLKLENEQLKLSFKNIKRNNNTNSINNISINNMIDTKEYITLKKEVEELKQKCDLLSKINIESLKRSCFDTKPKDGEYDKSAMFSLIEKYEDLSNLKVDFPRLDKLIQNYEQADYNYKETEYNYNLLISKVKELLLTNDKKTKDELCKLIGL